MTYTFPQAENEKSGRNSVLALTTRMNSPFVTKKIEDALKTLKLKKAPSPDNRTNEMLLYLGPRSKKKLLQIV